MEKIGFIGSGNIATALIAGLISYDQALSKDINISDIDQEKLKNLQIKYNVNTFTNNLDVVNKSNIIVIAVKPKFYNEIINEIKDSISSSKIIVSIAPGFSIKKVTKMFNKDVKVTRAMPNTPSLVKEGMTALSYSENMETKDINNINEFFSKIGKFVKINEEQFDAFTAVCGSAPAFVYMFINALSEGGIDNGLPKEIIYDIVSQTVLGSAKMVLTTKENPIDLRNKVSTKGGTTIEGVNDLNNNKFKEIVISAVNKTTKKSKLMNKEII